VLGHIVQRRCKKGYTNKTFFNTRFCLGGIPAMPAHEALNVYSLNELTEINIKI
jgi:hypothetical protein